MTWTNWNSIFNHFPPHTPLKKIQTLAFLLSIYETAAADRLIQTHSLGPGFLNDFHDGIHVEVAFAGGSWANTDSFVRHFHVNLRREYSALTDAPSKNNYHHPEICTQIWLFQGWFTYRNHSKTHAEIANIDVQELTQ